MSHPEEPLDDGILHAYLDGALPADEARRIEARISASSALQARLERARGQQREADALLALVELDAPLARPDSAVRPPRATPTWWQNLDPIALRWAAGFMLMVGGVWVLTPSPSREAMRALTEGPRMAMEERADSDVVRLGQDPSAVALASEPTADAAATARKAPLAAPASPPPPAARQLPRRIDLAAAATFLGGSVRTLPDAQFERADLLGDDPPLVQLTYRLPDGTVILLTEEPLASAGRADNAVAAARTGERARARAPEALRRAEDSATQLRWSDGALQLELEGPVPAETLRRLREGVQK
jgi:anti-sigma factor RsiW